VIEPTGSFEFDGIGEQGAETARAPGQPACVFGPVDVWRIDAGISPRVAIDPKPVSRDDERLDRRWREMCESNPRFHDEAIWSVRSFDASTPSISVSSDRYKRYAVRPTVGEGATMLAVRGVITARDGAGREFVLLGLRSSQTRIYGNCWEVIPGGGMPADGVDVPPDADALIGHLRVEAREEAGLSFEAGESRVIAFCHDRYAGGFDVLVRVELRDRLDVVQARMGERDWEHQHVRWLAVDEMSAFDAAHAAQVSPPTRAITRFLGWVNRST
jgi:8-oxo-dGTP pyrophosphatase MutT (NUDIX family)